MSSESTQLSISSKAIVLLVAVFLLWGVANFLMPPRSTEDAVGRVPDKLYSYTSSQGSAPTTTFTLKIWEQSVNNPCTVEIHSAEHSPRLTTLAEWSERGLVEERHGLIARVLTICAKRYVFLDGGGDPGQVREYVGNGAPNVVHGINVKSKSVGTVVLELEVGAAPNRDAEIARLELLAKDSELALAAIASEGGNTSLLEQQLVIFNEEAKKLKAK